MRCEICNELIDDENDSGICPVCGEAIMDAIFDGVEIEWED